MRCLSRWTSRWSSRWSSLSFLLPFALVGLLQGCSSLQPVPTSALRHYHEVIAIKGRFSVSYEHEGRPQSAQGRFQWAQRGAYVDIDLLSPLGQTLAKISLSPGLAKMEQAGREPRFATDAAELTAQMLGWAMPVDGLRDWLQGYSRRAGVQQVAAPGGPDRFDGDGWQVRYVSWQTGAAESYPKRIDLSRAGGDPLALRIVIDGWEPR